LCAFPLRGTRVVLQAPSGGQACQRGVSTSGNQSSLGHPDPGERLECSLGQEPCGPRAPKDSQPRSLWPSIQAFQRGGPQGPGGGRVGGEGEVCQDDEYQNTRPTHTVIKEWPLPLLSNSKHFEGMWAPPPDPPCRPKVRLIRRRFWAGRGVGGMCRGGRPPEDHGEPVPAEAESDLVQDDIIKLEP
jgi:hypothetical protein